MAALNANPPEFGRLVEDQGLHGCTETEVPAKVEPVGHVAEVGQNLGLLGIAPAPGPVLLQGRGEPVAVVIAFAVAAGAWIAVPVPGAAYVLAALEAGDPEAEAGQLLDGVEAGEARADDDGVIVGNLGHLSPPRIHCITNVTVRSVVTEVKPASYVTNVM